MMMVVMTVTMPVAVTAVIFHTAACLFQSLFEVLIDPAHLPDRRAYVASQLSMPVIDH